MPKFRLKLLDGGIVESKDLRGKVTVIDFWAVWCKPCVAEIPDYNRFYREYKGKGVRFIAVASDSGTENEVRQAVQRLKMEYPVAAASLQELDVFGDLIVFPTTWIVDKQGRIAKEFLGAPRDKHETLRAIVNNLLKQPVSSRNRPLKEFVSLSIRHLVHLFNGDIPEPEEVQLGLLARVSILWIQRFALSPSLISEIRGFQQLGLSGYG